MHDHGLWSSILDSIYILYLTARTTGTWQATVLESLLEPVSDLSCPRWTVSLQSSWISASMTSTCNVCRRRQMHEDKNSKTKKHKVPWEKHKIARFCLTPCPTSQAPIWFCFRSRHTSLPYPLSCWACFSIRLLVFALYSSRRFRWLDLRATAEASMGERTHDVAMSNTKLLAAMPCDLNLASANAAVRLRVAVRALVLLPLLRWTLLASKRLRVSVLAFFFGFFCCGWSFCCCWRLVGEPALLCVRLLNFCTHLSQDLCNLSLRDLAAASLQPGVCSLVRTLYV